jgi:hypothetical protein
MQPDLIDNLEKKFGEEVSGMQSYNTPGTPRFKIVKPTRELEVIKTNTQSRYRSAVGMLFYLIKYSRPDIGNAVRELSKCMDGATLAAHKEMLRVIRLVLDTEFCLKMEPNKVNMTEIFLFIVILIELENQRTVSVSQGSSFTVGGSKGRNVSLCPAVKPNML